MRQTLRGAFLAATLALLLASTLASAAAEQSAGAFGLGSVRVEEATLKLVVYPDGAVRPLYKLRAVLVLNPGAVEGDSIQGLSLVLDGNSSMTSDRSTGRLEMSLRAPTVKAEGGLDLVLGGWYRSDGGGAEASLNGSITVVSGDGETKLVKVNKLVFKASGSMATIELDVETKGVDMGDLVEKLSEGNPVDEANRMLRSKGIDYLTLEEVGVSSTAGGATRITAKARLDIDRMLQRAVANGMPREDAEQLRKLLRESLRIESHWNLRLNAKAGADTGLTATMSYKTTSSGELEKAQRLNAEMQPLLQELMAALLMPVAREKPEAMILVTQVMQASRQAGIPLLVAPPTDSRVHVEIRAVNATAARITVDYEGDRLRVPAEGEQPDRVAEKTLVALGTMLQQLVNGIGAYEIILPGISGIIPTRVQLEAAPGVELSKTVTTFNQLAAVTVKVKGGAPATTTTKATAKTTRTTETTGETTRTSPATATGEEAGKPAETTATATGAGGGTATTTPETAAGTTGAATTATATGTARGGGPPVSPTLLVAILVIAAVVAAALLRRR